MKTNAPSGNENVKTNSGFLAPLAKMMVWLFPVLWLLFIPQSVKSQCSPIYVNLSEPSTSWSYSSGSTSSGSDYKVYQLYLYNGNQYKFTTCSATAPSASFGSDPRMILYNSGCTELSNVDDACSLGPEITYSCTSTGTYYLRLQHYNGGQGVSWNMGYQKVQSAPADPTSISISTNPTCPGGTTRLTANGAVGTVYWYTGGCGSTQIGTGSYLDVNPSSSTTYYARNYNNSLYSSGCASATVTVSPGTPSASSSVSLSSITATTATVSWTSVANASTYYWVVGTSAAVTYGSGSWYGTTSSTSVNVTGLSNNTTYYARVYANNSCGSSGYTTSSAFITLPANPTSISASSSTICTGSSSTLTANGVVGTAYWYSGSCGGTYLGTGNTLVVSPTSTTTYYLRNYANSQYSASCASATITVNPTSVGGSISGGTTVCSGTNSTTLTLSGHTGTVTKWQYSSVSDFSSGVNDVANTTTSLTATNLTATRYYRAVVTSGVCTAANSSSATITVTPVSAAGSVSGAATVCAGTNSTTLTVSGHTGTVQWQSSTNNSTFSNLSGETGTTYTATNLASTMYYRVVVTNGICAAATGSSIAVTVNPASVGGSISGGTTVCTGTNSTTLTLSGHTGSVTKWQYSSVSDFSSDVNDVANATTSLTATNLTATRYYRAVVTSGVCSATNSGTATISVTASSVAGSISGATTVCSGTNSTTLTLSGNTGTIQWQSSANNSTFSHISGATGSTYTATNLSATTYYRAVVTNGVCAAANTSSVTMTVNATPSVAAITGTTAVCAGLTTTLADATASGVWSSASTSVATITSGGVVTGVTAGTSLISYTVTSAQGCVNTATTTVTVSARLAAPTASAAADTITSGTSTTISATGAGSNISWYTVATAGTAIGNTGNGVNFTVSPTNTTTYYAEANTTASFYINSLSATNSAVVDHNSYTGDDCGGIAVTSSYFYYTGDNNTVRYTMPGLTSPTSVTKRDGMFSDLGTGTIYTLWNGSAAPAYNTNSYTVTQFRSLNTDLGFGSTYVTLSQSIALSTSSSKVGIFAGAGFVILKTGDAFYRVDIPSGTVTNLGSYSIAAYPSESWAIWGVAEKNGAAYSVLYRTNSANTISRIDLSNGNVSTLATFTNLGDMAAFTYSPWHNRWYFHHEGSSQFGGSAETAGYADGSHTSTSDGCPSISRTPVRVVVITMPTVTTASISDNGGTTATGGGEVTSSGGAPVLARGVCWSTSQTPTTSNSKTTDGTTTGVFTSSLTNLTPGTTYYVRAYVTTRAGTAYGTQVNFTAASGGVIAGSQTVCMDGTPTRFTSTSAAVGITSPTYTWQISTDSTNFTDLPSSNSTTYQAGTISEKTFYRRKAVSGAVTLYSNIIRVMIDQATTVPTSVTATPATITSGQSSNIRATVPAGNQVKWFNAASGGTLLQTVASATNYSVSPTTTTTYYAETSPISCTDNPLSTVLSNLNANYTNITSEIPSRYTFSMDGSGGVNSNQISDGGNDMYDGGNLLSTNHASQFNYSDNTVKTSGGIFGTNGKFFTRYVSGLFVLAADLDNVSSFSVYGNYGSDGGGSRDNGSFTVTVGCKTFQVYVARVYNAGDPSINEMFIVPSTSGLSFTPLANTGASTSTLSGLSSSTRMYYLLYAGSNGAYINNTSAQSIATAFLNQVSATVSASTSCPSPSRVAVTVTVSAAPTITTAAITDLAATTATAGGNISSDGGSTITARGVCWSTSANPTTSNNKTTEAGTTGSFNSTLTGLTTGTTYYLRAYATNAMGTSYGNQVTFAPYQLGGFANLNKVYGDAPFTLVAPTSASPGAFSYTSSNESVATMSGSTVTIHGAGTATITATQAASGIYGSSSKTCLLTVSKANQVLTLSPLPTSVPLNQFVGNLLVTASASSGLPVTISLGSGSAADLLFENSNYYLTGIGSIGTVTIIVDQAGNANYNAAQISQSFDVTKGNQTITFDAIDAVTYGTSTVSLSATASSSLDVTFTVLSGPGSISGNTLTITGAGAIVVEAAQAGNASWNPATSVQRTQTVNKAMPSITFANMNKVFGADPFTLSATSASSGAFSYSSSNASVATVAGSTATITGAGVSTITASQAADDNYLAASADATLTVGSADQTITWSQQADVQLIAFDGYPIQLSATASSGLPVSFSVEAGSVATINGSNQLVSTQVTGTVIVIASQAGNDNFNAVTVRDTFLVTKAPQTISFAVIADKHLSDPAFDLDVSASSDLGISLSSSNTNVATISNKTVTIVGIGTTTITATQAGNAYYEAAEPVERTLTVLADVFNTWTGAVSTDWFNEANWQNNAVPDATTDVVIPDVTNQPNITSGTALCAAITIQSGATVTVASPGKLQIAGAPQGTGHVIASVGTVEWVGTDLQTIPATFFQASSVYGLTVNNPSGVALSDALNITGVLTVTTGTFYTNDYLTLKSNLSATARVAPVGGYIEGNVTVERYIPAHESRAWRLLAVPTMGSQTIRQAWQEGDVNPGAMDNNLPGYGTIITNSGSSVESAGFDEVSTSPSMLVYTGSEWSGVGSTFDPISTTSAYFLYVRGDRSVGVNAVVTNNNTPTTLRTTGALYQGDITLDASGDFTAMGNLYASPIDFSDLTRSGSVSNRFYLWDAKKISGTSLGAYQTFSATNSFQCVLGGGSFVLGTPNTVIQSGQGFFVQGSGSVTFHESAKVSSSHLNGLRPANELVKLDSRLYTLNNNVRTMMDANVVVFDNQYAAAVDGDDAGKLSNTGENFAIGVGNQFIAIEGRPELQMNDTIFFRMWNLRRRTYELELVPQNLIGSGFTGYLVDKFRNTTTTINLSANHSYSFTVDANTASAAIDRFMLVLKPAGVVPVTFVRVAANRVAEGVQVDWAVATEFDLARYDVQRSLDGTHFTTVGSVPATAQQTAVQKLYQLVDRQAPDQTLFYRIKPVDQDGGFRYSTIVKVSAGVSRPSWTVAPNPVTEGYTNLQMKSQAAGRYQVRLLSAAGQTVFQQLIQHTGGTANYTLRLPSSIVRGSYQLQLIGPDKRIQTLTLLIHQN